MIDTLVHFLDSLVLSYGVLGLFAAGFLEEVIAPIPSALVMLSGGFVFLGGEPFSPIAFLGLLLLVAFPIACGLTLGSLLWYGLAYFFGKEFLVRFGPYIGLGWEDVEKVENWMRGTYTDNAILFFSRAIPTMPALAVNLVSGMLRFPLAQYIPITFVATLSKAFFMGLLGWQVGSLYREYAAVISRVERFVLLFILLMALGFVLYRLNLKRRAEGRGP